ncbi:MULTISPECIES: uracil-DNA glycosylase [unclassified Chelatococcus]|uniref:uracil-DNA glycosylase n=1 Tax=unclassified Chelatococcus TaxID=2638111 RepID=UPI001BCCCB64|nr:MULTISPECIES: uracil-DNA glycosylase [unclassified Chelatococcus]MBS7699261.1 uracil-DNA glycosylase [Chelatococcus sp. YT9]MBX3557607.1 uracil-DNA glycosylase [Chelatococcus sp.]
MTALTQRKVQHDAAEPGPDCPLCPRLVAFRQEWRAREPRWHNAPVPAFGPSEARLMIVGLAPGLRGANRTGRPFTGDYAGDLLYATLAEFGFAHGHYRAAPDDGLALDDGIIVNAVRCVPPQNKPTGVEITTCRSFLTAQINSLPRLSAAVALGRIAHESVVRALGSKPGRVPFSHGAEHDIGPVRLFDSYHCSRYNTNTRVLTPEMFRAVFRRVRAFLDGET